VGYTGIAKYSARSGYRSLAQKERAKMSEQALAWLASIPAKELSHAEYRILNKLCWLHDAEKGYAWPSIDYLIQATNCSKRAIINCVDKFAALGVIHRVKEKGLSNKYEFQFIQFWTGAMAAPTSALSAPATSALSAPYIEQDINNKNNTSSNDDGDMTLFELNYWNDYPRKVGKKAAFKAWKRHIKGKQEGKVMLAYYDYVDQLKGKEEQFIPHLATWINGERWNDGV